MTDGRNLKTNYSKVLEELENQQYIQTTSERFENIKRGVWRVHFDLHPSRVWEPMSAKKQTVASDPEAVEVVRQYRKHRFPELSQEPLAHEVKAARSLLDESSKEGLLAVTKSVASKVASLNKGDLYFGFAAPYFRELLIQTAQSIAVGKRQSQKAKTVHADVERLEQQEEAKRMLHQYRLKHWQEATDLQRTAYLKSALAQAPTTVAREQILNASLKSPPAIVMRQIPQPVSNPITPCL